MMSSEFFRYGFSRTLYKKRVNRLAAGSLGDRRSIFTSVSLFLSRSSNVLLTSLIVWSRASAIGFTRPPERWCRARQNPFRCIADPASAALVLRHEENVSLRLLRPALRRAKLLRHKRS